MILIADSGSTKTDWAWIEHDKRSSRFKTRGFNPFYIDSDRITSEMKKAIKTNNQERDVKEICFYGAGCSTVETKELVKVGLNNVFPFAKIQVYSDMLGACRALFHHESGISVILGTGANSCLYDGQRIVKNIPPLGYVLGDYGSGASLGKELVTAYLSKQMPEKESHLFRDQFPYTIEDIKKAVYKEERPNLFLASFTPFLSGNMQSGYITDIVKESFIRMFNFQVCSFSGWEEQEVRIVGSVGYYFKEVLKSLADEMGINLTQIIKSPMDRLIEYHSEI